VTLAAALGLGFGLLAGMVGGSVLGNAPDRLRHAVRRFRASTPRHPADERELELAVSDTIRETPGARGVVARVHALGEGLVELTGTAPDPVSRRAAGEAARAVPGADIVVNRILVEGSEAPVRQSAPDTR
jgi:osmotically-inducible protein OsmY